MEDHDGADIKQFNDSILMSSKECIKRTPKTHGWNKDSSDSLKPCKDGETEGHPVSPMPADCLDRVHEEDGFKEGTVEHTILEKKMGFQCHVVLGELMHAMVTAQPDINC